MKGGWIAVMMLGLSLATAAPAAAPSPAAPDPAFSALPAFDLERIDGQAKVMVGDTIVLRIGGLTGLTAPSGPVRDPIRELRLEAPAGTENLTDQGWEVDVEDPGQVPAGELRVRATPLKAGQLTLPSLAIVRAAGDQDETAGSGDGDDAKAPRPALARTNPVTVQVESAIRPDDPKAGQPAEMLPPVSLPYPWWAVGAAAIALLALTAGGWLAYRRLKGNRKAAPAKPAEPPKPEDEVALAALAQLERDGPLRRGEFKAHYFRVSEILKAYIGARYDFDASESTTREMIAQLEERKACDDARIDRLETLFGKMDLVKFTDHVPLPDEGPMLIEAARELVRATRRPPPVLAPGKEAPPR
jgi:hypothetical protein